MEQPLILTPENLAPAFKQKIPDNPKFFHFTGFTAAQFHEPDIIIFRQPGKPDLVLKDRYGKASK